MKYGLFIRGKMLRLTKSLEEIMTSRAYEPWNPSVEVYEFKYNASGMPIDARLIK
jgi:hypothetical protein